MTAKGKAGQVAPSPASNTAFTEHHSSASDPLQGWFNLAKPARNRSQKRSWKRGKQQGRIDPCLLAELALLAAILLLIVGGLTHA